MALPRAVNLPVLWMRSGFMRAGALALRFRFAASRCTRCSPRSSTSLAAASATAVSLLGLPFRFTIFHGAASFAFLPSFSLACLC